MTNQHFITAICADPADTTLRLAFADWLEDHGQTERAEFIRVQLELPNTEWVTAPGVDGGAGGKIPRDASQYEALRHRERELLRLQVQDWIPPIEGLAIWTCFQVNVKPKFGWVFKRAHYPGEELLVEFRRGFPEQVTCRLGDWIGEECQRCSSRGWVADDYRVTGKHQSTCFPCHGAGRINAFGPAIVQTCPVREVVTIDVQPDYLRIEMSATPDRWFWRSAALLVEIAPLKFRMFEHLTEAAARAALSDALIAWARAKAGLPSLQGVV